MRTPGAALVQSTESSVPFKNRIGSGFTTTAGTTASCGPLGSSSVVLVKANVLPRTGMGKIQRYQVRQQFLQAQKNSQTV